MNKYNIIITENNKEIFNKEFKNIHLVQTRDIERERSLKDYNFGEITNIKPIKGSEQTIITCS